MQAQMPEEMLKTYDCFNKEVGRAARAMIHAEGLWHRAVVFLLLDPTSREIIFQNSKGLEDYEKENFFLKLNGGHITENDTEEDIFRELQEELGLSINPKNAFLVGKYQLSFELDADFKRNQPIKNREFISFYIVCIENAFEKIKFEDGEVKSIIKFEIDKAIELLLGKVRFINATARDEMISKDLILKPENFKNFTDDNLYLRIMIASKRYLDGEDKNLILL
jgi:8-oxo-dGTP pyrophosphatase MutT (NUDIX family)